MVRCSLCVSLFAICTSPPADFYVPESATSCFSEELLGTAVFGGGAIGRAEKCKAYAGNRTLTAI
jgi:hypothetical protein